MCTVEVCVRIELRMVAGLMSKWRSAIQELLGRTALVARFLCLLHVTNTYLCSPTLAYGPSMFPTLNMTGDVLLVEHLSQRFGKVCPGDVVVVRSPLDPRKILTKRIVGMAGHSITFVPDPVLGHRSRTVVVPEGHVWIQGDNIYDSIDSRLFGPIPYALIEGKVLFRDKDSGRMIGLAREQDDSQLNILKGRLSHSFISDSVASIKEKILLHHYRLGIPSF